MTEQEFAAIRRQWRETRTLDTDQRIDSLIRAVDERDAIIHDLTLDGSALSRRAVEEFAAGLWDWVNIERQRHQMTTDFDTGAACALGVVQARIDQLRASGTAPDPLPPAQVRQENERLRGVLRAIKDQVGDYLDTVKTHSSRALDVVTALGWLREMASETQCQQSEEVQRGQ